MLIGIILGFYLSSLFLTKAGKMPAIFRFFSEKVSILSDLVFQYLLNIIMIYKNTEHAK
jgi:hypothetical protein